MQIPFRTRTQVNGHANMRERSVAHLEFERRATDRGFLRLRHLDQGECRSGVVRGASRRPRWSYFWSHLGVVASPVGPARS